MKTIEVEDKEYEIIKDYKNAFDKDEFVSHYTEYFYDYDYLVGDIAYGKLRLKGFYDSNNKKVKSINNYNNVDRYLLEDCATDCKHFILKKIDDNK